MKLLTKYHLWHALGLPVCSDLPLGLLRHCPRLLQLHMGFPDLDELMHQEPKKRPVLSGLFCLCLGLFYVLLFKATEREPGLYSNTIFLW